jgi:hypothetical protein
MSAVIDHRAKAEDRGSTSATTSPTSVLPRSNSLEAQWFVNATARQRLALTIDQELEAWGICARVNHTNDWRELRDLTCELDGSRGGNLAESLPDWVIDAFVMPIRERMDVPLIGSVDDWAALPYDDRYTVSSLHSAIVAGHAFYGRTPRDHRHIVLNGLNDTDGRRLPEWARRDLLALLDESVPPETPPATGQGKAPTCSTEEEAFDEFCGGSANGDPLPPKARVNRKAESSAPAASKVEPTRFRVDEPWPEGFWGLPNWLARSALCSSFKNDAGYYGDTAEQMVELQSLTNLTISASGPRLHQGDLDPILMSIHSCRFGDSIETTPARFLHGMQRGDSTRDVDELIESLTRISNCHVEIVIEHRASRQVRAWKGPLIRFEVIPKSNSRRGRGRLIRISLDPKLGEFCRDDFTWVEVRDRAALRQHRMAAGLHAFYSTHVDPHAYTLELIRSLLGVSTKGKKFECLLRSALELLEEKGIVLGWAIDAEKLTVTPKLTPTKIKFLAKKGITPTIIKSLPADGRDRTPATSAATSGRAGWWRLGRARAAAFRAIAGFITRLPFQGRALARPDMVASGDSKPVDLSRPR